MPSPDRIRALLVAAAMLGAATSVGAQEFIRQTVLVAPLRPADDSGATRRVAGEARSQVYKLTNHKELAVVSARTAEDRLFYSGYDPDAVLSDGEVLVLAKRLRVDEVVLGSVVGKGSGPFVVRAEVAIVRDWRQRQPLPVVRGRTAAEAGMALAREVVAARAQMTGLRRCENALRFDLDGKTAAREAERAIVAYPRASLARACLMYALVSTGAPSDSVRRVAEAVLAVDSLHIAAAVTRALALEAERRPVEASAAWVRVTEMRPDSLELAVTAIEALMKLARATPAHAAARRLLAIHEKEPRLRRLLFRASVQLAQWPYVAALGDSLERDDPMFQADSSYTVRYIEALRQTGDSLGALSRSARAVKEHPGDSRLYTQYVQVLGVENIAALPRGIGRFPEVSDLHLLAAKSARGAGKRKDAIAATTMAVRADPELTQGYLQLAELWFEEQRPDSAFLWLARAPRGGPSAELLRTYTIGRGGQLLRAAADTAPATQRLALRYFELADSIVSRDDTRSYMAATGLQIARADLVTAAKTKDCADIRRADEMLQWSSAPLERGIDASHNGDELRQAFDAMRTAVDNATKILCKDPKAGGGPLPAHPH